MDVVQLRHVCFDCDNISVSVDLDFVGGKFKLAIIPRAQSKPHAFSRERKRDGFADTFARTRDKCHFSLKAGIHFSSLNIKFLTSHRSEEHTSELQSRLHLV